MEDRPVSVEEIKKHASEQDCWIVVDDVVWDITEFIPSHPGGNESECIQYLLLKFLVVLCLKECKRIELSCHSLLRFQNKIPQF